jgi:hypothetical protein
MADLKISQLSSATALAGTEVVPVVQGGSTKKATIDQILSPASGKGINFSAAGGDTLTIYDEGTYTAVLTPQTSGTIPVNSNFDTLAYTRIGRQVTVTGQIQTFNPVSPVGAFFTLNLPFAVADLPEISGRGGFMLNYQNTAVPVNWSEGDSIIYISKDASTVSNAENLYVSFSYFAA